MLAVINGSCFWKPKFESLAREVPFDLKHRNSSKSALLPDQQGLSVLWFMTALDKLAANKNSPCLL